MDPPEAIRILCGPVEGPASISAGMLGQYARPYPVDSVNQSVQNLSLIQSILASLTSPGTVTATLPRKIDKIDSAKVAWFLTFQQHEHGVRRRLQRSEARVTTRS